MVYVLSLSPRILLTYLLNYDKANYTKQCNFYIILLPNLTRLWQSIPNPRLCLSLNQIWYLWLFIIYINNLDSGISSEVSKFADDTKVGRIIRTDQDASELQGDLDRLYDWARKWQMEFNIGKCNIFSVGRSNPLHNYSLHDIPIDRVLLWERLRSLSKIWPPSKMPVYSG